MIPEHRNRICGYIGRKHNEQVRFLAELVKVPSDNPPGNCAPHALRVVELLTLLGFHVECHRIPSDLVMAAGMVSAMNLIVRRQFGTGSGPVIALNAHGDVVPPGEGWTTEPYGAEIHDGTMYGRGVAVSKSDIATYAFALKSLEDADLPLNGTVELHFTYDEEVGGLVGPSWLLQQNLTSPDFVISAGFSYSVVVAHNGCLHLEVRVAGRSAHAARPDSGIDALEATTKLLTSLYALRQSYVSRRSNMPGIDHPTLVVGLISGGINTNVVPDVVTMRLDRRIIPEEDPAEVERELTTHIEMRCAAMPGISVNVRRILLAEPLKPLPGQRHLVAAIRKHASDVFGESIPANGVALYTDARHYNAANIPTVLYGAGPRTLLEANGHRADEKLVLEDLCKATQVVALSLADLLGVHHDLKTLRQSPILSK